MESSMYDEAISREVSFSSSSNESQVQGRHPTKSLSFLFGKISFRKLENSSAQRDFQDIYVDSGFSLLIDYEAALPFIDYEAILPYIGALRFKIGSGLFLHKGEGVFDNNDELKPQESFRFIIIPLNFGLTYKAQFFQKQGIVPYIGGGISAWPFVELRDDRSNSKFGAVFSTYATAGLSISLQFLKFIDPTSFLALEHEYGIRSLYFISEYSYNQSLSKEFDFSGSLISFGLSFNYN